MQEFHQKCMHEEYVHKFRKSLNGNELDSNERLLRSQAFGEKC